MAEMIYLSKNDILNMCWITGLKALKFQGNNIFQSKIDNTKKISYRGKKIKAIPPGTLRMTRIEE